MEKQGKQTRKERAKGNPQRSKLARKDGRKAAIERVLRQTEREKGGEGHWE